MIKHSEFKTGDMVQVIRIPGRSNYQNLHNTFGMVTCAVPSIYEIKIIRSSEVKERDRLWVVGKKDIKPIIGVRNYND